MVTKTIKRFIVGIDSSTTCTGVSVLEVVDNKLVLINYKAIRTDGSSLEEKSVFILSELLKIIEPVKDECYIAIEQPNSSVNMNITRMLCGLWGYICFSTWERIGIFVESVNTGHVKKTMTGDGSADKAKMVKIVNRVFKLSLKYNVNKSKSDDDIADAIAVAYTYFVDNIKQNRRDKNGDTKAVPTNDESGATGEGAAGNRKNKRNR